MWIWLPNGPKSIAEMAMLENKPELVYVYIILQKIYDK